MPLGTLHVDLRDPVDVFGRQHVATLRPCQIPKFLKVFPHEFQRVLGIKRPAAQPIPVAAPEGRQEVVRG